jgi:hypothetical protein
MFRVPSEEIERAARAAHEPVGWGPGSYMPPTMPSAMELATDSDFDKTIRYIEQLQGTTERMRLIVLQSKPPRFGYH